MKIAMLTGSFLPCTGGMEYVIHYLSEALVALGHDVVVFTKKTKYGLEIDHVYEYKTYGYVGLPFSGRLGLDARSARAVIKSYHAISPIDILHCHSVSYTGSIAMLVKDSINIPLVMTPHGEDIQKFPEINYGVRLDKKWDKIVTQNLLNADAVTAISESVEIDIPECIPKTKIYRVPNGVNLQRFKGEPSTYLQAFLKIDKCTRIILSVGRNHIKKGYQYGIEAFSKSGLYREENIKYVIIGGGVTDLTPIVDKFNMKEHVFLIEKIPQEELAKSYRSATLFLSPSITEGLSMVSIEALAAGIPILATDVPGNRDIVNESGCGVLVPSRDVNEMAKQLILLMSDEERLKLYNELAQEKVIRYDWENIAKEYIKVYKNMIKN